MSTAMTAEQLTGIVADAIRARDFDAVTAALMQLAVVDPARAQEVYDTVQAGIRLGTVAGAEVWCGDHGNCVNGPDGHLWQPGSCQDTP